MGGWAVDKASVQLMSIGLEPISSPVGGDTRDGTQPVRDAGWGVLHSVAFAGPLPANPSNAQADLIRYGQLPVGFDQLSPSSWDQEDVLPEDLLKQVLSPVGSNFCLLHIQTSRSTRLSQP